jgi:hypothetical protein
MFLVIRRLLAGIPASALLLGWLDQPAWLVVPPALMTAVLIWRHRLIRNRIGVAPWASDGFARHAFVDDLAALLGMSLLGLPLFFLGNLVRSALQLS